MKKRLGVVCSIVLYSVSLILALTSAGAGKAFAADSVEIRKNQLFIDGVAQPQLFGAELQYFRLRGGYGRNIPREKVIELWNRALDRMVEAKMNAISFYIPWDFHEYAEGKFDFTGTVDEDGDGRPDYPSRDLFTFFKLIEEHGIHRILVRPGPYINAEWGFLGFGAVPLWFHRKFPESHMRDALGNRARLYDYTDPEFRRQSEHWLRELHRQVLSRYLGPGGPIAFLQLDNETNYMWQSLYNQDYSAPTQKRYRNDLRTHYTTLAALNAAHGTSWKTWDEVRPPVQARNNLAEDRDWYRFNDETIHDYLISIRKIWENLGVREPHVLFTLAESYNAPTDGLLPNYRHRNDPGATGMMTVNLYPKTYESSLHPKALVNNPFKPDHDVKAVDEAKDYYLGRHEEWVLGPEIQGGWWPGIPVSPEARKQTYLSTLGHGLKALFIYYFHEGDNWDSDWVLLQVKAQFEVIHARPEFREIPTALLPPAFWTELQTRVDREVFHGIDAKQALETDSANVARLHFDSPLDGEGNPSRHYPLVKEIGEKLIAPYQDLLASAREMNDPVCLLKDVAQHLPSVTPGIDSVKLNSDWAGGLLGYLMQAGINPRILHWGLSPTASLAACRLVLLQDDGTSSPSLAKELQRLIQNGAIVVNLLDSSLAKALGFSIPAQDASRSTAVELRLEGKTFQTVGTPLFHYTVEKDRRCHELLWEGVNAVGYRCALGQGSFVQIGALIHEIFNTDSYFSASDLAARSPILEALLRDLKIEPRVQLIGGGDRLIASGRISADSKKFWVTVRNARRLPVSFRLRIPEARVGTAYVVKDLFGGLSSKWTGEELTTVGASGTLPINESTVYFVEEQ